MGVIAIVMIAFIYLCILVFGIIIAKDIHSTFYIKPLLINLKKDRPFVLGVSPERNYNMYTFYSEKYEATFKQMKFTLEDDRVTLIPFVVEQSKMDRCFSKHKKRFYDYRWRGCDIKIDILLECIRKNQGDYIIFVDSDLLFLKPISPIMDYYSSEGYDLVLTQSCMLNVFNDYCLSTGANIGVMFIRCNAKTLNFFEKVKKDVEENGWDEGVVKKRLEYTDLKHSLFPAELVSTQFSLNDRTHLVKIIGSYIGINKNDLQKQILSHG
jgi:hypothetical protein